MACFMPTYFLLKHTFLFYKLPNSFMEITFHAYTIEDRPKTKTSSGNSSNVFAR